MVVINVGGGGDEDAALGRIDDDIVSVIKNKKEKKAFVKETFEVTDFVEPALQEVVLDKILPKKNKPKKRSH
jgi:DNA-directed RNA polymerase subunit K/omega